MPPARDIVLLLTHSADYYTVDRVAEELSRRGVRPLRVDTDGFPAELELTSSLGPAGDEVVLRIGGRRAARRGRAVGVGAPAGVPPARRVAGFLLA